MMKVSLMTMALAAASAFADPSVTVDSVVQRWPWNNKVDITYTVGEGQDVAAGVYARLEFTAHIGVTNITIDGVHDIGANASNGTHTVTYTLPSGLKATGCTMTAKLIAADNPSGDDYMVVNLSDGAVSYEGLLATQEDSDNRYNTNDVYKTSKLVLRKVPAGIYKTGCEAGTYSAPGNGYRKYQTWTNICDYYVGVFPVTKKQYAVITGGSGTETTPVVSVTYNTLRAYATPGNPIPAVTSNTGSFFQRLNWKSGLYFDLPTMPMTEIAARAGATTKYHWGDDSSKVSEYAVCGASSVAVVGSKLPNAWGIYDTCGNVREWCLDRRGHTYSAFGNKDAFTANTSGNDGYRAISNLGYYSLAASNAEFMASSDSYLDQGGSQAYCGFRVYTIIQ